ncbi:C-X-C chemokine receptor type 1, partial [Armadillidium vulgare]
MHRHLKRWHCNLIILVIWIVSIACAVPFYIFRNYGVRYWEDLTEVYCEEVYEKTFIAWLVIIIVLNWIPLTVMLFCYTKLFMEFKKHAMKVEGKEHPGILNMKKRFVKMLFAMIIVFTLCWLPFQLFVIFNEHLVMNNDSKTNDSDEVMYRFTLMEYIVYLNPAVNPFIYGLMHENFKRGFRVTFKCFFKKKPNFVLVPSYGGSQRYVWTDDQAPSTILVKLQWDDNHSNNNKNPRNKSKGTATAAAEAAPQAAATAGNSEARTEKVFLDELFC